MRMSQELKNHYPQRLVWWMECDGCHKVSGNPVWEQKDISLESYREQGWSSEYFDYCPECVALKAEEASEEQ